VDAPHNGQLNIKLKKQGLGAPAVGLIWTPAGFKMILDEGKLS
jgi:hypothetical protein